MEAEHPMKKAVISKVIKGEFFLNTDKMQAGTTQANLITL